MSESSKKGIQKMATKYALITGGAGGLGGAMSSLLLENGWHVFIADFDASGLAKWQGRPNVSTLQVDVTDANSVAKAATHVTQITPQIDAIINFAGIMAVGSLVEMPAETIARILNVNVMGTVQINRAFFPLIKRTGKRATSGRIVNISSETGWETTAPFNGPYSMSKFAIEAYTNALRRELQLLHIPVIKIQPGPFKTEMTGSISRVFSQAVAQSPTFGRYIERLGAMGADAEQNANPPRLLADVIYRALLSSNPRASYSVKADPLRAILTYMPTRLADWILYRVCQPK